MIETLKCVLISEDFSFLFVSFLMSFLNFHNCIENLGVEEGKGRLKSNPYV